MECSTAPAAWPISPPSCGTSIDRCSCITRAGSTHPMPDLPVHGAGHTATCPTTSTVSSSPEAARLPTKTSCELWYRNSSCCDGGTAREGAAACMSCRPAVPPALVPVGGFRRSTWPPASTFTHNASPVGCGRAMYGCAPVAVIAAV